MQGVRRVEEGPKEPMQGIARKWASVCASAEGGIQGAQRAVRGAGICLHPR
jgi:hypothetical protein